MRRGAKLKEQRKKWKKKAWYKGTKNWHARLSVKDWDEIERFRKKRKWTRKRLITNWAFLVHEINRLEKLTKGLHD